MFAVTFYGYIWPDKVSDAKELGRQMYELVQHAPGYIELQRAEIDACTELSIVYFDTEENVRNWYNDPRHREVMKLSRKSILRDYRIEVCEVRRAYTKDTSNFEDHS